MSVRIRALLASFLVALFLLPFSSPAWAGSQDAAVPLVVGNRTVHVFRGNLGDISPEERAEAARRHITEALDMSGEGWTSIEPSAHGVVVAIDGKPMFTVIPGDARGPLGETPEGLANQASRVLQKVWAEHQEHGDERFNLAGTLKVAVAFVLLAALLVGLVRASRRLREWVADRLSGKIETVIKGGIGRHVSRTLFTFTGRAAVILAWCLGLVAVFAAITYSLNQFAITRPIGEEFVDSFTTTLLGGMRSAAGALPGLFVAVIIFSLARVATQVSNGVFGQIESGRQRIGALDAHTAPATRHLVNAALWMFGLVMAYPYLPGSQTEAFKGLSVLLGVMMSIGASGLVGQIASGMILVFTRALLVGEYVRLQECEGTVAHLGLCVTRLRTGTGEEISLPNSLVVSQVTRNFSRNVRGGGYLLETSVSIGYDTPWRQVQALLVEAARQLEYVRTEPDPQVLQTELADFYVNYRMVVQVGAETRVSRPRARSELHAAIQDTFNRHGVQIMSPHYLGDPAAAKVVPESRWYEPPAEDERIPTASKRSS